MSSYNRVTILGNCTRPIEVKYLQSGTAVAELGLAVNDREKKGDQWVDVPTFVDVSLFGRTAEIAGEHLSKGSSVLIEGRLKLDTWEKDGKKHQKLKVVGDRLVLIGGKPTPRGKDRDTSSQPVPTGKREQPAAAGDEEDIPF